MSVWLTLGSEVGRLTVPCPLPIPTCATLDSAWGSPCRLHVFKTSSFLSLCWRNLRGSWQHGMLLWESLRLCISFQRPYQKASTLSIWKTVTVSLWPPESLRLKTAMSASAGNASCWVPYALGASYTVSDQGMFASLNRKLNRSVL